MNRRRSRTLTAVVAVLCVALATLATESDRATVDAAETVEIGDLEGLLPPGVRQVLSAFRIFEGISARNAVYREADDVQSDLSEYYDARIATAKRQLAERSQLGLADSQLRAYWRVVQQLEAERATAVALTEFEKRVAKYGFESAFKAELTSALLMVPKVRAGLDRMTSAVGDLQSKLRAAQEAIRTGNPVGALTTEIEDALATVERFGGFATLVSGDTGESIAETVAGLRSAIAPVTGAIEGASGAADDAIGQLDSLLDTIAVQSGTDRAPRGGMDILPAEPSVLDTIAAATGNEPGLDAISSVISRQAGQRAGSGGDPIDPTTMWDRVRSEVLRSTLDRIAEKCGRIVGEGRRVLIEGAAAGAPVEDPSTLCDTYSNPEQLDALIDRIRSEIDERVKAAAEAGDGTTSTTDGEIVEPPRVFQGPGSVTDVRWGECTIAVDYELILYPNFTATLLVGALSTSGRTEDDTPICLPGDAQLYSGDWSPVDQGAIVHVLIGNNPEFPMEARVDASGDGPAVATLDGGFTQPALNSAPARVGTFSFVITEVEP